MEKQIPQKIVSLTPGISEWIGEILGEKDSLQRLIGVSEYSQYPKYVSSVPTVGPYPRINVEKVASLHPDLVIASAENTLPEQIEKLRRLHLKVEVLPAESFSSMEPWLKKLGDLLQEPVRAQKATKRWSEGMNSLKRKFIHPRENRAALIEVQHEPLIVVGGDSFLNEAFSLLGYRNIFGELKSSYPKISKEAVLKADPEFIFIFDMGAVAEIQKSEADWGKFGELRAVKNKHLVRIPADDFARCSLRLLDGLNRISAVTSPR